MKFKRPKKFKKKALKDKKKKKPRTDIDGNPIKDLEWGAEGSLKMQIALQIAKGCVDEAEEFNQTMGLSKSRRKFKNKGEKK